MTHTAFHNKGYTLHINAVVQHSYTFFPDGNLIELIVTVTWLVRVKSRHRSIHLPEQSIYQGPKLVGSFLLADIPTSALHLPVPVHVTQCYLKQEVSRNLRYLGLELELISVGLYSNKKYLFQFLWFGQQRRILHKQSSILLCCCTL